MPVEEIFNSTVAQAVSQTIGAPAAAAGNIFSNIWMWIAGIEAGVFGVLFVFLIMYFIAPAKGTIARDIIRAKRKKMKVFIADNGVEYKSHVCNDTGGGTWMTEKDDPVTVPPAQERISLGNVPIAVGESESMKAAAPIMADVITRLVYNNITPAEVKDALKKIEDIRGGNYVEEKEPEPEQKSTKPTNP